MIHVPRQRFEVKKAFMCKEKKFHSLRKVITENDLKLFIS